MSAMALPVADLGGPSMLAELAGKEIRRYARHPLFIAGAVLTVLSMAMPADDNQSSLGTVIAPAAGLGVIGLVVMASLARSSDVLAESAGTAVVGERTRTLALASTVVVPLTTSLVWLAWAVWALHDSPPTANGTPFGGIGDGWAHAVLFALGVLPAVGGPMLGLVIGRWLPRRGAAPVAAVLLVLVTIMLQGLFEPLRYIRVLAPWTQFTGPFGIDGDPNRVLILTGSPYWYAAYLAALSAVGLLVAVLHDREQGRSRLLGVLAATVVLAVVLGILAMTMGVQDTMINPLRGPDL